MNQHILYNDAHRPIKGGNDWILINAISYSDIPWLLNMQC